MIRISTIAPTPTLIPTIAPVVICDVLLADPGAVGEGVGEAVGDSGVVSINIAATVWLSLNIAGMRSAFGQPVAVHGFDLQHPMKVGDS